MFATISATFSSCWSKFQDRQMWSRDKVKELLLDKTEVRLCSFSNILMPKQLNLTFRDFNEEALNL